MDLLIRHCNNPLPEISETCQIAVDLINWRVEQKLSPDHEPISSKNFLSIDPAPASNIKSIKELEFDLMNAKSSLFHRYRAMFALRDLNTDDSALALTRGNPSKVFHN